MDGVKTFGLSAALASAICTGSVSAAPPEIEPIDVNVVNTTGVVVKNTNLDPVPVNETESASEWAFVSSRNSRDCTNPCSFLSVSVDVSDPQFGTAVPPGKALLIETVTITYGSVRDREFHPSTAAIQVNSPFQRHVVGEMLETPGFTGAWAMATAKLNAISFSGVTGVVGFTDPADQPTGSIAVDIYVAGRIVDAQ